PAARTHPPRRAPVAVPRAVAPRGKNRTCTGRRAAARSAWDRRSYQWLPAGTRRPFMNGTFALSRPRRQHGKTVDRRVQPEETFEHGAEQEGTSARELFFVEIDFDATATGERQSVLGEDPGKHRCAAHPSDAVDLLPGDHRVREVVDAQRLAKRVRAGIREREVVERQLRDEPPRLPAAERRLD